MNQGLKFRQYVEKNGLTIAEVSRKLDIRRDTVYAWFEKEEIKPKNIELILTSFGVKYDEVFGYNADIDKEPNLFVVPFKSYAGFLRGYGDGLGTHDNIEKIYYPFIKGEAFAFQIGGQSAYPLFPENTWFCGKPLDTPDDLVKGRLYTWQTVDGIVTKIFDGMDDEYFYISSVNPDYNPVEPFHRKNVKVIYRQVGKLDSFES